jgi:hypothetical protein
MKGQRLWKAREFEFKKNTPHVFFKGLKNNKNT